MRKMAAAGLQTVIEKPAAGILLPISALPSTVGAGDFGQAHAFIDFLFAAGIGVWQVLPLGPTHSDFSPYLCTSSCAGNPYYIDLDWLRDKGWLAENVRVQDFDSVAAYRDACMCLSYGDFKTKATSKWKKAYRQFQANHSDWLESFALFTALRRHCDDRPWLDWEAPFRDANPDALSRIEHQLAEQIDQVQFEQFAFYCQWLDLKKYAHRKGVKLFGDMPLFVAHDSVEVWQNRRYFQLRDDGAAAVVAGVPPDYFSQQGQCWGNPVFNWSQLQADGFQWWIKRLKTQLALYDLVRIDHFRGLEACWEIPAGAGSAAEGQWQKTPGQALLTVLHDCFGRLPLVAEDLGFITEDVHQLRDKFHLPGMHVTQFAFDGSTDNPHLRQQHKVNSVAYTGTHDNNTTLGWYQSLCEDVRADIDRQLNRPDLSMPWSLIEYTLSSVAQLVVLPMQDILALDGAHRLNTPGMAQGNWRWQFHWRKIDQALIEKLRQLVDSHNRLRGG